MGAGRGVQGGALAPPWNLKVMTSYAVCKQNAMKILLAPSALAWFRLKLGIKTQNRTKSRFFLLLTNKSSMICVSTNTHAAWKLHMQMSAHYVCTPLENKIFFAPPWENFCRRPCEFVELNIICARNWSHKTIEDLDQFLNPYFSSLIQTYMRMPLGSWVQERMKYQYVMATDCKSRECTSRCGTKPGPSYLRHGLRRRRPAVSV